MKLVIFIFSCIWLLIASEVYLRVFKPHPMLPRYVESGDFGVRVNMPNESYFHNTADYRVHIKTNAKGLRAEQDIPYQNEVGKKRVLLLGDSFGMGYGVNLEDTFTEVMRKSLESKTGEQYEVINLSVSGFGTAEQLLMLKNEGVKYTPDIVVATWHSTDLTENVRSQLFSVESSQLVRNQTEYLPGIKQREFLYQFPVFKYIAENSNFYNFARGKLASFVKYLLLLTSRESGSIDEQYSVEQEAIDMANLNLLLLKELEFVSLEVGAKFLVLDLPNRDSRTSFSSLMPAKIAESFKVVSPLVLFTQHSDKLLYWENSNWHFTPFGCNLVGNTLADAIYIDAK